MKECRRCLEWKNKSQFAKNSRTRDLLQAYCKDCMKAARREWYLLHAREEYERVRGIIEKHPEETKAYQKKYWEKYYKKIKNRQSECL